MASRSLALAAVAVLAAVSHASTACDVDICFAMSGDATFRQQQGIVGGTAFYLRGMGGEKTYAAVQYTTESVAKKGISRREKDPFKFAAAMYGSKANGGKAFPASGLNYCFGQIVRRPKRGEPEMKPRRMVIVLLGPGTRELGSDPVERAGLFSRIGGKVYAVGIGRAIQFKNLKNISRSWWRTLALKTGKGAPSPWETGLELGRRICMEKIPM